MNKICGFAKIPLYFSRTENNNSQQKIIYFSVDENGIV